MTRINILNILLMLLAACGAFAFPVELLVLAYAVLGPLHYLTEISWLNQRDYFLPGKKQSYVFFALSLVTTLTLLVPRYYMPTLSLLALLLAVFFVFSNKIDYWILAIAVAAVGFLYIFDIGPIRSIVLLLPTLIHVSLFTLIFIYIGALKSKSISAYLSLATYILCLISIAVFSAIIPHGSSSEVMLAANQLIAPYIFYPLMKLFHINGTEAGVLLCQRIIAFAYFYHYLNWFSKTGVIQWHKLPVRQLVFILVIYSFNLIFYYQSFYLGFLLSYLLSIGHVYLEFPLNIRSMSEVLQFSPALAKRN